MEGSTGGEHGALEEPAQVHKCQPPLKRDPPEAQQLVSVAVLLQAGGTAGLYTPGNK